MKATLPPCQPSAFNGSSRNPCWPSPPGKSAPAATATPWLRIDASWLKSMVSTGAVCAIAIGLAQVISPVRTRERIVVIG
ncbi:hypothetical protein [Sphingomonas leidyi]|uniref:hypothetical protein n=1 Tax=Sphingomonas leidyi TaxID=68569 RepID=UPI0036D322B4